MAAAQSWPAGFLATQAELLQYDVLAQPVVPEHVVPQVVPVAQLKLPEQALAAGVMQVPEPHMLCPTRLLPVQVGPAPQVLVG